MENDSIRVLALIPANNEGRHVADVARIARDFLPVLVVDDGSSDDTAASAISAGAEVLAQNPRQGKGAALLAGFEWAIARGYDAVVTLDADGQHDPSEIPAFLDHYRKSRADLIIGRRDFSAMPPVRRFGNTIGTGLFSWAVGKHIPDNQSGYRLISQRMMNAMRAPGERGFEFEVEMIIQCVRHRYSLGWVPIRTIYGDEKSHINPLRHAVNFIRISVRARRVLKSALHNH